MTSSAQFDPDLGWLHAKPGVKWHANEPDVLAAGVADMDFATPPQVRAALTELIDGGDLGYPAWVFEGTPLRAEFAGRMAARHQWSPNPAQVREFNDVIQAFQAVLHVATRPGDAIAMHTPGYPPFLQALDAMHRHLVPVPLRREGATWRHDPDALADAVLRERVRALVLVNPHNPTGKVFTAAELAELGEIAATHDLLVISDEIHAELAYPPARHRPFAATSGDAADRTVTLTSATKAFNIAGVRCALAHVGSAAVRYGLATCPPFLFGEVGVPGVVATLAAWRHGDAWLAEALRTLAAGRALIADRLAGTGIDYLPPEATYLSWLDCRALGLDEDPADYLLRRARVQLMPGPEFGPGGAGFTRLNFGTSPRILDRILDRVIGALPGRPAG